MIFMLIGSFAVSYTHLDVYKRQVLTVVKTAFEPRMASVKAKIAANRKPISVITSQDIEIDLTRAGLKGSPTKVKKTFTPPMKGDSLIIKEDTAEASVRKLVSILDEKSIISVSYTHLDVYKRQKLLRVWIYRKIFLTRWNLHRLLRTTS